MKIPAAKKGRFEIQYREGSGKYCKLYEDGRLWTMDSPLINQTQQFAIDGCYGKVIVGGLGTGWVVKEMAKKPEITELVVVEIAQEVIDLVWPYLELNGKGSVICADLFEYLKSPIDANTIYIDIYNNPGKRVFDKFVAPLRRVAEKYLSPDKIFFWEEQLCIK